MGCRTRELREKAVISVCNGRCVGYICDFEVEPCSGKLCAIFVPAPSARLFGHGEDICIPWDKIVKIGEDTILVDLPEDVGGCECCADSKRRLWRRLF